MSEFQRVPPPAPTVETDVVEASLEGGPASLPAELRRSQVSRSEHRIKVRHCGGYEHFERADAEDAGTGPVVFHWIDRTAIAE